MCLSDSAKSQSQLGRGFFPLLAAGGHWEQRIHRVNDKQEKKVHNIKFPLQIPIGTLRQQMFK